MGRGCPASVADRTVAVSEGTLGKSKNFTWVAIANYFHH